MYIIQKMENALMMLLHAVIIGVVLYVVMVFALRQSKSVALNRSMIAAAVVLIYMLVFGHRLPRLKFW
jgi:hypothetical protein